MTAFSRQIQQSNFGSFLWEIRSVNHRYLEINIKLPEQFRLLETNIREIIPEFINRGKLELVLKYEMGMAAETELTINEYLVKQLLSSYQKINENIKEIRPLTASDILRWPGVVQSKEANLEYLNEDILKLLQTSLADLKASRQREGKALEKFILERCDKISENLGEINKFVTQIRHELRERLNKRIAELTVQIDEARLEQEIVLALQKSDIAEEIERLQTHVHEVIRIIRQGGVVGRRLDFLMQELNREANTMGAKTIDSRTTNIVVDLKVLIEQMREQVQNIE